MKCKKTRNSGPRTASPRRSITPYLQQAETQAFFVGKIIRSQPVLTAVVDVLEEMLDMDALNDLLNSFVTQSQKILGYNLIGIYLHGSAVMGCYNEKKK